MTLRLIALLSLCFIAKNLFAAHPNDDLAEKAIVACLAVDAATEVESNAYAAEKIAEELWVKALENLDRCSLRVHHDHSSDQYKKAQAEYKAAHKAHEHASDNAHLAYLDLEDAKLAYADAYVAYRGDPNKYVPIEVGAAAHRAHEEAVAQRRRELAAAKQATLNPDENKSTE